MLYVVQVEVRPEGETESARWEDVTIVSVPPKTKRKTVVARAVDQFPNMLGSGPTTVRVIPAEHAEPIKVEMEQPPPQLKIG